MRRLFLRVYSKWLRGAVTLGPPEPKVALTFDDGPDDRWTPEILGILAEHGARATFFMLGAQIERHPALAGRVADEGHELAVHLYSHDRAAADDDDRFRDELERTEALVRAAAGAPPRFIRFPFAYLGRQRPRRILSERGLETAHWSISSMDSRYDPPRIQRRLERALIPGAIALLHDGVGPNSRYVKSRRSTVEALPGVLRCCREKALAPVILSDLLGPPRETA